MRIWRVARAAPTGFYGWPGGWTKMGMRAAGRKQSTPGGGSKRGVVCTEGQWRETLVKNVSPPLPGAGS